MKPCNNPECTLPFEPTGRQLYCSRQCMFRARYLRHAARDQAAGKRPTLPIDKREDFVCGYGPCEQTFRPYHPSSTYCCPEHKYLARLMRMRKGTARPRVDAWGSPLRSTEAAE